MADMRIQFTLNGQSASFDVHPGTLLSTLIGDAELALLDNHLIHSQLMLAAQAHGRTVTTAEAVEPMPGIEDLAHLLSAHALLERTLEPSMSDIEQALDGLPEVESAVLEAVVRAAEIRRQNALVTA